jgi:hypothetical protein
MTRIHNASPTFIPLFVQVTFTSDTSFDQAVTIMGRVYPWSCDEPRSPTPPPLPDQRANFAVTHHLFISYPSWDQLTHIAAASQVVSVDGVALYPCS